MATGAGLSGRTLYTNTDETVVEAKRPLLLTGINPLALRGDIADRANKTFLEQIKQSARKDEASFWREFEAALSTGTAISVSTSACPVVAKSEFVRLSAARNSSPHIPPQ